MSVLLAVLGVAAVVASVPDGPRWQLLPVVVAALLAAGTTLASFRRRVLVPALVLTALTAVGGAGTVSAFPPLQVPEPSGPHAVGTTELAWKAPTDRADHLLVAQVWYPAARAGGPPSLYLGRDEHEAATVANALASTFGAPSFLLREAQVGKSPAVADAAAATGRFPVVLFSPGDVSVRRQNTAWAVDVASHGYVVVALDHPYDSAVQVDRSGRATGTTVHATGDDARDNAAADGQVRLRARQMSSALDQLGRVEEGLDDSPVTGHLDLARVVASGHSLGGAAAMRAAADDSRVDAAIDLDGLPRTSPRPEVPVLIVVAGRGTGDAANDVKYRGHVRDVLSRSRDGRIVTVPQASHLSFTDAPLFLPPVPSVVGSLGREGAVRKTSTVTEEFLHDVFAQ